MLPAEDIVAMARDAERYRVLRAMPPALLAALGQRATPADLLVPLPEDFDRLVDALNWD
jgi:hypothetical protein